MKAPDKIYIQPNIGERELIKTWFPVKIDQESIEYTRTDAFIKKALERIKENIRPYYHEVRYKYEDFKKYMKGE